MPPSPHASGTGASGTPSGLKIALCWPAGGLENCLSTLGDCPACQCAGAVALTLLNCPQQSSARMVMSLCSSAVCKHRARHTSKPRPRKTTTDLQRAMSSEVQLTCAWSDGTPLTGIGFWMSNRNLRDDGGEQRKGNIRMWGRFVHQDHRF